jgi:hypothetical protein
VLDASDPFAHRELPLGVVLTYSPAVWEWPVFLAIRTPTDHPASPRARPETLVAPAPAPNTPGEMGAVGSSRDENCSGMANEAADLT